MSMTNQRAEVRFEDANCTIAVSRPEPGIVVVTFEGHDAGAHGDKPFKEIAKDIAAGRSIELFIDARGGRSASMDVSSEWARWLAKHRASFAHVSMLTGSRFVQLSADFVRKYSELGDVMRVYTDTATFESALASAIAAKQARSAPSPQKRDVEGGCHCGTVRYSASLDLAGAFRCNCSICAKTAATIGACEPSAFRLRSGEGELSEYRFGSGALTRFFCRRCGIQCFARGSDASGAEFVGININTLEGIELSDLAVVYFDGRHDVFEPRATPAPMYPKIPA